MQRFLAIAHGSVVTAKFFVRLTLLATAFGVCAGNAPTVSAIQRREVARVAIARLRLSVDANPKTNSDYRSASREEAIRMLKSSGATHFHVSTTWASIEPRAGVLDLSTLSKTITASAPLPVAFTLKIVDAGHRQVPERFRNVEWDSPEMVQRLVEVIDQLASLLGSRPWSYAIGNEIDLYLARRPQEIAAYARLLEQLKPIVNARHPMASFTTVWQFNAIDQSAAIYRPILDVIDHVALTYYPINADFSVRPPDQMARDLPRALAAASPLPITFQELGYPSATLLGSSPDQQAEFMRISFELIRAAGTSRVLGATYLFQSDLPQWLIGDLVRAYGFDDARFRAFLGTLGLRDENDRPKAGWHEFMRQTELLATSGAYR
jgi:hypothetical protein